MNSQPPTNNYGYNSQFTKHGQADPSTSHKIDMLCLAILVLYFTNIYSSLDFLVVSSDLIIILLLFSFVILYGNKEKIVLL